ncbi:MAG: response regulator transcription factor [Actinomycetota bacterium]|jgi:two-component system, NarL family, response regulator LiaR|nr:response regulator transcription factor [Actinomycetota bacterium]
MNQPDSLFAHEPASAPFRVVVVDDVEWVRSMLSDLLGDVEGVEVCGTASDGDQAVDLVLAARPDAVLMALKMPRVDGISASKDILNRWPEAKILLNTAYGDAALVQSALAAGVVGYVTKDRRPADLIDELLKLRTAS